MTAEKTDQQKIPQHIFVEFGCDALGKVFISGTTDDRLSRAFKTFATVPQAMGLVANHVARHNAGCSIVFAAPKSLNK